MSLKKISPVYILLVLAILFYCLDYFFRISPSLVLLQLLQQYHMSPLGIAAMASAFYLGYVIFQLPAGWLFDRFNYNKVMIVSIVLCTIFYWLFIFSTHYEMGLIYRFLIGATSAFSFIGVLHLTRAYLPLRYFSFVSGITIALGTVAAAFAQFISALFLSMFNWHDVLSVLALWGIIIAILISISYLNLRNQSKLHEVHPVIKLQSKPHSIKSLFMSSSFMINALIGGLIYLPTSIFAGLWGITFLKTGYHLIDTQSSFAILLLFVGWAVGSPVIGWWSESSKKYLWWLMLATFLLAVLTFIFIRYPEAIGRGIFTLLFLFGLLSSFQVLVWRHFNEICPLELSAAGIALTNMVIMLSTSFFHVIVGKWIGDAGTSVCFLQIQHGLYILPIVFLAAAGLLMLVNFRGNVFSSTK